MMTSAIPSITTRYNHHFLARISFLDFTYISFARALIRNANKPKGAKAENQRSALALCIMKLPRLITTRTIQASVLYNYHVIQFEVWTQMANGYITIPSSYMPKWIRFLRPQFKYVEIKQWESLIDWKGVVTVSQMGEEINCHPKAWN